MPLLSILYLSRTPSFGCFHIETVAQDPLDRSIQDFVQFLFGFVFGSKLEELFTVAIVFQCSFTSFTIVHLQEWLFLMRSSARRFSSIEVAGRFKPLPAAGFFCTASEEETDTISVPALSSCSKFLIQRNKWSNSENFQNSQCTTRNVYMRNNTFISVYFSFTFFKHIHRSIASWPSIASKTSVASWPSIASKTSVASWPSIASKTNIASWPATNTAGFEPNNFSDQQSRGGQAGPMHESTTPANAWTLQTHGPNAWTQHKERQKLSCHHTSINLHRKKDSATNVPWWVASPCVRASRNRRRVLRLSVENVHSISSIRLTATIAWFVHKWP